MKSFNKILFGSVIIAMGMVSCSQDDMVVNLEEQISQIVDSDQPVVLSSGSSKSSTRASIESDDNGLFELPAGENLGVFMLAKDCTPAGTDLPIDWTAATKTINVVYDGISYKDIWSVWINNDPASVIYKYGDDGITKVGCRVDWDEHKVHYYPYGYYHTYSFYAYYPFIKTNGDGKGSLTVTQNNITAKFNCAYIDGTKDILAGTAISDDDAAFSAKWARNHVGEYPELKMEHRLMKFDFTIKAGAKRIGGVDNYEEALITKVKGIRIYNVPTSMTMVVADKNAANVGKLTWTRDQTKAYALMETNEAGPDQPLTAVCPTIEGLSIGQGIMLPAISSSETKYDLQIELEYLKDNTLHQLVVPMRLDPKVITQNDPDGAGEYHAGKAYQIVLTINSPEEIGLSAYLKPWDVETGGDILIQ